MLLLLGFGSNCYAIDLSPIEKDYLRSKKHIIFVSQSQYPPFEFTDDSNQHQGMMMDVVGWLAIELGFQPVFVNMTFQEAQETVLRGQADIITSLFFSEKRQEKFVFTTPLFDVPASIFVKSNRPDIKDLNDLKGKTIAIQKGDYAKEFLESKKIDFKRLDVQNFAEATDKVIDNQADAVIGDEQIVWYHVFSQRLTEHIKKMNQPLYTGKNCMAANRDNALLIGILNKGIKEAHKSGILLKISQKWLGTQYIHEVSFIERYLIQLTAAFGCLLLLLVAVWVWNLRLRILVDKKTAEIVRSEQSLRKSERNFRSFFDTIDDMTFAADLDGNIFYANTAASIKLGYSQSELQSMTLPELHAAHKQPEVATIFSALSGGKITTCPLPLKAKTGHELPVESRGWRGQWNNTDCIFCISKDLSREQEALQKFNQLFNNNPALMTVTNLTDKTFTDVNAPFLNTLGFTREDVIGKTSAELDIFLNPDHRSKILTCLRQEGRISNWEVQIKAKDGTIVEGIYSGEIIESQGQQYFLNVLVDQTQQKRVERELQNNEQRFRSIFDNSVDGILFTEQNGSIFSANPAACQILGWSEQEINAGGRDLIVDLTDPRLPQALAERSRTGKYSGELNFQHKNGQKIEVELSSTIFSCANGEERASIIFRDITERKQWERQRRQLQKTDSLNRMAGAIAHHFNNMLGAVLGNLELLLLDLPSGSPDEYLHEAMKAAVKATETSTLMLTYLGQSFIRHELLHLTDICQSCLPMLSKRLPEGVILHSDFPSPGPTILANPEQIQQALKNLVDNAAESIDKDKGTIHLAITTVTAAQISTAPRFPVDWQPHNDVFACLEIKDNGSGITKKDIDQIFDPFFSTRFTGRGLGLPVVLGIARAHDGVISVESAQGEGSLFKIFFPLSRD